MLFCLPCFFLSSSSSLLTFCVNPCAQLLMFKPKTCHTDTWEGPFPWDVYVCLWGIGVIFNKNYPVTSFPSTSFSQNLFLSLQPSSIFSPLYLCLPCHFSLWGFCVNEMCLSASLSIWGEDSFITGVGGHTKYEDLIPNFEDVLLGGRWEEGEHLQVREGKVASLKWRQLFSLKSEQKNDWRRGEKGPKENIQVFDFFPSAPSCIH